MTRDPNIEAIVTEVEAIFQNKSTGRATIIAVARLIAQARAERDAAQERACELALQRDGAEARMARIEKERDAARAACGEHVAEQLAELADLREQVPALEAERDAALNHAGYEQWKAEFDSLRAERDEAKQALADAEADYDRIRELTRAQVAKLQAELDYQINTQRTYFDAVGEYGKAMARVVELEHEIEPLRRLKATFESDEVSALDEPRHAPGSHVLLARLRAALDGAK